MPEQREFPVTFERGLNVFEQPNNLLDGESQALENWMWLPGGGLAPRPGWKAAGSSPSGEPASKRGRGLYTGWYESGVRKLVAAIFDNSTSFNLYRTNVADPTTFSSYTAIETGVAVAASNRPEPVDFATGMSILMYTNPGFPSGQLRTWNGSAVTALATDGLTGGSLSNIAGRALVYHLNRFWTGGALTNPTYLRYSEIGDVDAWNTDENFIPVGQDDGEPIEAICIWDRGLVIGKQHSLWFLSGYSVDTFTLSAITGRLGCGRGKTLIPTPLGVFVYGIDGNVHIWDGADITKLSKNLFVSSQPSSGYLSMAWIGGQLFCSSTALPQTVFVWDPNEQGRWRKESLADASNAVQDLATYDERYLISSASAGTRLLSVRQEVGLLSPGTYRDPAHDPSVAETYVATSKEWWPKGPLGKAVLKNVYVRYRQWAAGSGEPLTITPIVDGVAISAQAKNVGNQTAAGVYAQRVDFAAAEDATRSGRNIAVSFSSSPASGEPQTYSIEEVVGTVIEDTGVR